ncbi:MAG: type II toxin-antitoxin system HicB family antitoxin [Clostridium sp.]
MKKDIYIFPAIFSFNEDGISIEFPDLPGCLTCGSTIEEATKNAKQCMGLHLYGMEQDVDLIPEPTPVNKIDHTEDEIFMLIEIYMPLHREAIENQSVKKTLTIPRWLNNLAEQNSINFSQVLQMALKDKLHLKP